METLMTRFLLRLAVLTTLLAFTGGCSNFVLGVIQSFGTPGGAKISTIAGNGTAGFSGDNGPATSAELYQPYDVSVDTSGNLYIADCNNSLIRMVNTNGIITTVTAASGLFNPEAAVVDSAGNLYICDTGNQQIEEVTGTTITPLVGVAESHGDNNPLTAPVLGTSVQLNYPSDIAVDSGNNLYIVDSQNSRILKLAHGTGMVSLVAGNGSGNSGYNGDNGPAISAHLNYPTAVAFDAWGNLYIADGLNFVIRKVDTTGTISTIAGNGVNGDSGDGGPALSAEIEQPYGIAVDASGNIYVSQLNSVVRKIDTNRNISTVAGNAHLGVGYGGDGNNATAALLDEPWGLAIDLSGNLLIADRINNRIRRVALGQ
jgi:trimeric autotransporter adhesin